MQPHLYGGLSPKNWEKFDDIGIRHATVQLRKDTWDIIQDGMHRVLHEEHGTAYWLNPKIQMAGKTGTAQNPHGEDHAWFIAYAPYENPKIAVSVLVEHGEHGSTAAAPIAVKLIREFIKHLPSQELLASKNNVN